MISTLSLPVRGTATRALRTGREGREDLLRCNMNIFYARCGGDCKEIFALHKNLWRPWPGILAWAFGSYLKLIS
jgi:hypothetical protein